MKKPTTFAELKNLTPEERKRLLQQTAYKFTTRVIFGVAVAVTIAVIAAPIKEAILGDDESEDTEIDIEDLT